MKRFLNHPLAGVLIFGLILFACSFVEGQNVRYSVSLPSISSATTTPYLVANVPPNSLTLSVCNVPANQVPCTNYATTYNSAGTACAVGAQDTPDPQPSNCQATADAQGNIGFWAAPGTYEWTACVQNTTTCYGPYRITLASPRLIQTVRTPYTYTSTDVTNGYARVAITFPIPFADTNYTVTWGFMNLQSNEPGIYFTGDMHGLTTTGMETGIYAYAPGAGHAGDQFVVHVTAIHD